MSDGLIQAVPEPRRCLGATRFGQDRSPFPWTLTLCTRSNSVLTQINRKLWVISFFCDVVRSLSLKCMWQVLQDTSFHMRPRFEAHGDTATRLPRGCRVALYMCLQDFARAFRISNRLLPSLREYFVWAAGSG